MHTTPCTVSDWRRAPYDRQRSHCEDFGKLGGRVQAPRQRALAIVRQRCAARMVLVGFTLLELLVVIAIIGLLAAYVGPKYFSQVGKSEQSVAKAQIDAFARAVSTYRLDVPDDGRRACGIDGAAGQRSKVERPLPRACGTQRPLGPALCLSQSGSVRRLRNPFAGQGWAARRRRR
jgi:prepilin-type N-terminal cleavage/methylation domain-containing protein